MIHESGVVAEVATNLVASVFSSLDPTKHFTMYHLRQKKLFQIERTIFIH